MQQGHAGSCDAAIAAARAGLAFDPPPELRAQVARAVLTACGAQALLASAGGWSVTAANALPGTFHALALTCPDTLALPGTGLLAALTEVPPDQPTFSQHGERLDQIAWPVRRDAALALWVARRDPRLRTRELATLIARWLADDGVTDDVITTRFRDAQWRYLAASYPDPAPLRQLLTMMWPSVAIADDTVTTLIADVAGENVNILGREQQLALAAHGAAQGWLAYDVHRRLPSSAAKAAAELAQKTAIDRDPAAWRELVLHALALIAADR
jgi:hypothetical protein